MPSVCPGLWDWLAGRSIRLGVHRLGVSGFSGLLRVKASANCATLSKDVCSCACTQLWTAGGRRVRSFSHIIMSSRWSTPLVQALKTSLTH